MKTNLQSEDKKIESQLLKESLVVLSTYVLKNYEIVECIYIVCYKIIKLFRDTQ